MSSFLYPVALYSANVPSLKIKTINDVSAPVIPLGTFRSPDVILPFNTTGPVTVTVSAENIPVGKTVTVKALPEIGNNIISASGALIGTEISSSAQVQLDFSSGTAYVLSATVNF
jgi:hypothetical protein